jgi:hypothetical protein
MIPTVENIRHIADEVVGPMHTPAASLPKAS